MPFAADSCALRIADPDDAAAARFVADHPAAQLFHRPAWSRAVEAATGHRAEVLVLTGANLAVTVVRFASMRTWVFARTHRRRGRPAP